MTGAQPLAEPNFVFGALRSGTTVFRLMLNGHDRLHNPGEVDFLFDFLHPDPTHPTGWRYDLEALEEDRIFRSYGLDVPDGRTGLDLLESFLGQFRARAGGRILTFNVHRHADRIASALPQARFIHLLRDPRDVARSSVGMGWAGLSYFGVDHWIATETSWDAAEVPPERAMTMRFEDLMADLPGRLGAVCDFLGVPFSSTMLDYHLNTTYGPPDPSVAEQWRRKATPREVALIDGKCGDLIRARGYAPGGAPHRPGAGEHAALSIRNRAGRWRAGIRRFGLPLFVGTTLTGRIGPRRLHRYLRRQMDAEIDRTVK